MFERRPFTVAAKVHEALVDFVHRTPWVVFGDADDSFQVLLVRSELTTVMEARRWGEEGRTRMSIHHRPSARVQEGEDCTCGRQTNAAQRP